MGMICPLNFLLIWYLLQREAFRILTNWWLRLHSAELKLRKKCVIFFVKSIFTKFFQEINFTKFFQEIDFTKKQSIFFYCTIFLIFQYCALIIWYLKNHTTRKKTERILCIFRSDFNYYIIQIIVIIHNHNTHYFFFKLMRVEGIKMVLLFTINNTYNICVILIFL